MNLQHPGVVMGEPKSSAPERLLTPKDVADILAVSAAWVPRIRVAGAGLI
jgi:hypothetical protein